MLYLLKLKYTDRKFIMCFDTCGGYIKCLTFPDRNYRHQYYNNSRHVLNNSYAINGCYSTRSECFCLGLDVFWLGLDTIRLGMDVFRLSLDAFGKIWIFSDRSRSGSVSVHLT